MRLPQRALDTEHAKRLNWRPVCSRRLVSAGHHCLSAPPCLCEARPERLGLLFLSGKLLLFRSCSATARSAPAGSERRPFVFSVLSHLTHCGIREPKKHIPSLTNGETGSAVLVPVLLEATPKCFDFVTNQFMNKWPCHFAVYPPRIIPVSLNISKAALKHRGQLGQKKNNHFFSSNTTYLEGWVSRETAIGVNFCIFLSS